MIDTKITTQRFKDHFYYSKWLYVVFILVGIVTFSMVFTITQPKIPGEYKIDISVFAASLDDNAAGGWEQDLLALLPEDQQEVNIYALGFGASSEETLGGYSPYEIIAARMAAREDDMYIMPKETYLNLASQGAFYEMDDVIANYEYPEEMDLEEYKVQYSEDENADAPAHYYGLPVDNALGLVDIGVDPREHVIAILIYTENYDNAMTAVDFIMNKTESEVLNSVQEQQGADSGQ
jgi:hypothetical protein